MLSLSYILMYQFREYPLPALGRKTSIVNEAKEERKISLNGTIHQGISRGNIKFSFSYSFMDFSLCRSFQNLWNSYNEERHPLYLRFENPSREITTFEIVMSQPTIKLTEIISSQEVWGSLELEVITKECQKLIF